MSDYDLMRLEISGLKCDDYFCSYYNPDIKFEEYSKYVNAECPRCGANLLTEEAHQDAINTMKKIERINKFFRPIMKFFNHKFKPRTKLKRVYNEAGEPKGWVKR